MSAQLPFLRDGDGPILVLVHGFLGGAQQWQAELEFFSQNCDVIAINLPGFGQAATYPPCNSIGEMADTVRDMLHDLGVSTYYLLGHSMGGMIAQELARKDIAKVKKLILYGTGPLGTMPNRFETIAESKRRFKTEDRDETIRSIVAKWYINGSSGPQFEEIVAIAKKANISAAESALDAMANWDGRAMMKELTMPTLILWGEADKSYRWTQVEDLWNNVPSAHLAVIPSSCHVTHVEKPAIFHMLVNDFLTSSN